MTLERASELVKAAMASKEDDMAAIDLFDHFVSYFGMTDQNNLAQFASLSGFAVCERVSALEE